MMMVILRMITMKDIDDDDGDDNGDDGGGVRQYISTRNIRQAKTYSGLIKQFGGRRRMMMRRMMMRRMMMSRMMMSMMVKRRRLMRRRINMQIPNFRANDSGNWESHPFSK